MAQHTLGGTSLNTYGYNSTLSYNEVVPTNFVSMPANGYVVGLHMGFGSSSGGAMTAYLLLFDNTYTLQTQSAAFTVYGNAYQYSAITPYYLTVGYNLRVGCWVGASIYFNVSNGGGWKGGNVGSPTSAGGFGQPGSPYLQGNPNFYIDWIDPVAVSSVSPSTATAGQTVTISGSGFTGGAWVTVAFNGIGAGFTIVNDNTITATVPNGYTTGNIVVNSDHGSGSIAFTEGSPSISSISPTMAISGSTVTISGSGFTDGTVTGVTFNGIASPTVNVQSNTQMTAVVPNGSTTGTLSVNTNHGSATTSFTEGPPTISSISPTNAAAGQPVTITGYGYTDGTTTSVTFTPAGGAPTTSTFTVNSNTQITATVPAGAAGNDVVTVNTDHGSATGNITIVGAYVWDGVSAWQSSTPNSYSGSSDQICTTYISDGTTWRQSI